jgi:uncharacterized membrane protein YfcA
MLSPLTWLLLALGAFTIFYVVAWWRGAGQAAHDKTSEPEVVEPGMPSAGQLGLGFVTNFFDTLGIGSFAPTTSAFKFFKMVPDRLIPGTLNVGHTLPTITEAFIYTAVIAVSPSTLIFMIGAAILGAWVGADVVASWSKRTVQLGMGIALICAALLFMYGLLGPGATTEGTLGLTGWKLAAGLVGNFALGALMTLGIGLYAPCMILIGLLGMNASTAFPIMMGSCAFLMPISSARFVQKRAYARRPALGLALGGIPGVLIAAYIVKSLPLYWVKWLVVGVVFIAASMMLRSAAKNE